MTYATLDNEMSPTHPDTFYAQTKRAAEQIVEAEFSEEIVVKQTMEVYEKIIRRLRRLRRVFNKKDVGSGLVHSHMGGQVYFLDIMNLRR